MADPGESSASVFGDDINSTPVSKIQLPPMSMSSKNDGSGPLQMPVYKPEVDMGDHQRRVSFDDTQYVREIPGRRERKHRSSRSRSRRDDDDGRDGSWGQQMQQMLVQPPVEEKPKRKKIFELAARYGHAFAVFFLTLIVLWYYPRISTMPYMGSGAGGLSVLGIFGVSFAVSGVYGVVEAIVD